MTLTEDGSPTQPNLLVDILRACAQRWRVLLIWEVVAVAIALMINVVVPKQWEATALIAQPTTVPGENEAPVLIARMRSAATMTAVLSRVGRPVDQENLRALVSDTRFSVNASFAEIRVRADSLDLAIRIMEAFEAELRRQIQADIDISVAELQNSLSRLEKEAASGSYRKGVEQRDVPSLPSYALSERVTRIQDRISELKSSAPRFATPPAGFPWPVFPNTTLLIFLGVVLGLIIGIVQVFGFRTHPK
jgi:hypothetical protein